MVRESADHLSPDGAAAILLTRRASPPVGEITYTCDTTSSPRLLVNAIQAPSGDHLGPLFLPVPYVSCFCVAPSVANSQRFDDLSSFSISHVVTSTTHQSPSGAIDGGPTRLIFQRSSAVSGRDSSAW